MTQKTPENEPLHAIYLAAHDEITTVSERIQESDDAILAILSGDNVTLLRSLVNLRILKRSAENVQKEILIISTDSVIRSLASQAGLRVFSQLRRAESELENPNSSVDQELPTISSLDSPSRDLPPKKEPLKEEDFQSSKEKNETSEPLFHVREVRNATFGVEGKAKEVSLFLKDGLTDILHSILGIFGIASKEESEINFSPRLILSLMIGFMSVIFLLFLYLLFGVLPSATITIVPDTQIIRKDQVSVIATTAQTEVNYLGLQIPAMYYETTMSAELPGDTTGIKDVGSKAIGEITVFNKGYSKEITLPKGFIIMSYDGYQFELIDTVEIPPARLENGEVTTSRKNNIQIQSVLFGEEYNIDETNFSLDGYDTNDVWAESYSRFYGGEKTEVKIVSVEDVALVRTQILEDLIARAQDELDILSSGSNFIAGDVPSSEIRVVNETLTPEIGTVADSFTLQITVEARGISYQENDIQDVVNYVMNTEIPEGYETLDGAHWVIKAQPEEVDFDAETMRFNITATGEVASKVNITPLLGGLDGMNKEKTIEYIKSQPDVLNAMVDFSPFWVTTMPGNIEKISIERITAEEFVKRQGDNE